jgi:hypothetical protein
MVVNKRSAIAAVERLGACLVFPLDNHAEPPSLWSHFHPRTKMRWEWDAGGDNRVPELWHLRSELSSSGQVAYVKWFRGRATLLSLPLFSALVRLVAMDEELGLGPEARRLYQCYEEQSPLSTKEVKAQAELQGKLNERAYERGMKELWSRLLVVGCGEQDDGAFPSLLVGASKWLLESAWRTGRAMPLAEAEAVRDRFLPKGSLFRKELDRRK